MNHEQTIIRLFPNASRSLLDANRPLRHAEPQQDPQAALGDVAKGKEESVHRIVVRFIGYRVRPLDPDNFAGSVKDLLDGLRRVQLIPGDEWHFIKLETEQEKVKTYAEERTVITIQYP